MKLTDLLAEKRQAVLDRWVEHIIAGYPQETSNFLRSQKDRFSNPVGHAIIEGTGAILDGITQALSHPGQAAPAVSGYLDSILRVRAVQGFAASSAVSFIFELKGVARSVLGSAAQGPGMNAELTAFDKEVDRLALLSFDIFMQCREKVLQLKADELERQTFRLLQQARLIKSQEEENKENAPEGGKKEEGEVTR
ncbi:MAG: RsbRD N-terminal domain-containing protein [Nitrospiraceae bacterium]|nr:RsbRD N-terminal domain-containing protein [Nitrospiraceae bacterium]